MVVHFNRSSIVSGRPVNKEKLAELQRRFREQEAEKARNPDKQTIKVRRVS
jgi:hypothetical protein